MPDYIKIWRTCVKKITTTPLWAIYWRDNWRWRREVTKKEIEEWTLVFFDRKQTSIKVVTKEDWLEDNKLVNLSSERD